MPRVLVADDHPMIRTALEALLRDTDYEIVGMAGSGEETLNAVERLAPDILLLDLRMPDGGGLDVLRRVRGGGTELKVVILTAGVDDSALMEAKALGVDGIVLKNSDPGFLLVCLDRVRHGRSWIDPEIEERAKAIARDAASRTPLAPRERQLIRFVRRGLKNRDIAARLGVTEGTVKTYLHTVFAKLGVGTRTELAIRAEEFLGEGPDEE